MEKLSGIETRVENDANIIAQGEAIFELPKEKNLQLPLQ